jgi:integrase
VNTDSGGRRINGAGGCAGGRAQELKHSGRQRQTSAGIVFNRFTVFPLGGYVLLALLLRRHQRAILRILRLQRSYQPGLLCQRLLLLCGLLACQLQPVRQQRAVTAKADSHQQQIAARKASGLSFEESPPTFHEIHSLAGRLYEKERGKDFAQKLLGHSSETMTLKYLNTRGKEYVML